MINSIKKIFCFLFSSLLVVAIVTYLAVPVQKLQDQYPIKRIKMGKTVEDDEVWVDIVEKRPHNYLLLTQVPPQVQKIFLLSEDAAFFQHNGVDFDELEHSIRSSLKKRHAPRGASTISQQLIKNIYFSSRRSWVRKIFELVLTIKLERNLSKKKILELYLNVVEFGRGLYGLGAATQYYFKKNPSGLSSSETIFLASLLPSPKKYAQYYQRKKLHPMMQKHMRILFRRFNRYQHRPAEGAL